MPRMDIAALRAGAPRGRALRARASSPTTSCRAYFRRADLVVLPYREIEQSGVLFTALAFGKPLLLSDVGGFPELAATRRRAHVRRRRRRRRCASALASCSPTRPRSSRCASARAALAAGELLAGRAIARRTLALYEQLLDR